MGLEVPWCKALGPLGGSRCSLGGPLGEEGGSRCSFRSVQEEKGEEEYGKLSPSVFLLVGVGVGWEWWGDWRGGGEKSSGKPCGYELRLRG